MDKYAASASETLYFVTAGFNPRLSACRVWHSLLNILVMFVYCMCLRIAGEAGEDPRPGREAVYRLKT